MHKLQLMASLKGGPLSNAVGGLTLAAATASGPTDLLGGSVLKAPTVIVLCSDAAFYFAQGGAGVANPVVTTAGQPGSSPAIGMLVPANTWVEITVTGATDQFINAISTPGGNLRWFSRLSSAAAQ